MVKHFPKSPNFETGLVPYPQMKSKSILRYSSIPECLAGGMSIALRCESIV